MALWNGEKDLYDFVIELRPSTATNFLARSRHGKRITIGPVAQHCIERIGDGHDASPQRNLFTVQLARIAASIEELMVGEDDIGGRCRIL